jgi:hypothetical protein
MILQAQIKYRQRDGYLTLELSVLYHIHMAWFMMQINYAQIRLKC